MFLTLSKALNHRIIVNKQVILIQSVLYIRNYILKITRPTLDKQHLQRVLDLPQGFLPVGGLHEASYLNHLNCFFKVKGAAAPHGVTFKCLSCSHSPKESGQAASKGNSVLTISYYPSTQMDSPKAHKATNVIHCNRYIM